MKTTKIILRIICSPLTLGMLVISFNVFALRQFALFMYYGGELIHYNKDRNTKTIQDVFTQLTKNDPTPNT